MKMNLIDQLEQEKGEYGNQYSGRIALHITSNDLSKISKVDNLEIQDGGRLEEITYDSIFIYQGSQLMLPLLVKFITNRHLFMQKGQLLNII